MVSDRLSKQRSGRSLADVAIESVFDRSTRPMFVADDGRRYVDANDAALALTGWTRDELLERRIDDLIPPEARSITASWWASFLERGSGAGTIDLILAGGRRIRVDVSSIAKVGPGLHLSIWVPVGPRPRATRTRSALPPSRREREVLSLLALGLDGPKIADELELSPATVRTHVNNALRKLGANTRAHAIALAIREGYVDP